MKNGRMRWWLWLMALAAWTFLLLMPGYWIPNSPPSVSVGDLSAGKLVHVAAYAILAAAAGWLPGPVLARTLIVAALIAHGALTEWLQSFVPWRMGCWRDFWIDTFSVVAGCLTSRWWWPR